MVNRLITITLVFLAATLAESQKLPSGSEVLQRVEKTSDGVQDYVASLEIDINMERVQIPRSKATMFFKKPDKIHFDSPGIALLPREGMALNSSAIIARYTAETVEEDTAAGLKVIKLQLAAKEAAARLRQLFAWVNPENWTVVRIQTIPYEGRLLTMDFAYGLQDGKFWMPVSLIAHFDLTGARASGKDQQISPAPDTPLDQIQSRAPRSGTIAVKSSDYKINGGLSDEIFRPKETK